jgi:hypothetical protein
VTLKTNSKYMKNFGKDTLTFVQKQFNVRDVIKRMGFLKPDDSNVLISNIIIFFAGIWPALQHGHFHDGESYTAFIDIVDTLTADILALRTPLEIVHVFILAILTVLSSLCNHITQYRSFASGFYDLEKTYHHMVNKKMVDISSRVAALVIGTKLSDITDLDIGPFNFLLLLSDCVWSCQAFWPIDH